MVGDPVVSPAQHPPRPAAEDLFELLSALAHDLRTPLTPVKGYAEILRTRAPALGPEKIAEYAAIIVEASARMERSVDLLSGISALYAGRAEVRPVPLRPGDLVAERLDIWRGREPQRTFQADTAAASGVVLADRGWLGRALDVYADQAIRSWPQSATIVLTAKTHALGERTSFRISAADSEIATGALIKDRLGGAFLVAVADVCGYPLSGPLEIEALAVSGPGAL